MSLPLITDASGKKFGKSEGNAVWLEATKTTPYHFYQFWLNVEDEKAVDYLKVYTLLSDEEIANIAEAHKAEPGQRLAQKRLAEEVTTFVHGREALEGVVAVSSALFKDGGLSALDESEQKVLASYAPRYEVLEGEKALDALINSGLAASKREAREFIEAGAVSLDGLKLSDAEAVLEFKGMAVLKRGKKQAVLIVKN